MTQAELLDKFFHQYLIWCSEMPKGDNDALVFWLDNHHPTQDCFWEWMIHFKKVPKS